MDTDTFSLITRRLVTLDSDLPPRSPAGQGPKICVVIIDRRLFASCLVGNLGDLVGQRREVPPNTLPGLVIGNDASRPAVV